MAMQPAGAPRPRLHEPLRKARTPRPMPKSKTAIASSAAAPRVGKRGAFLAALAALGVVAMIIVMTGGPEGKGALTIVEGSQVQWDARGRIIQVSGPDPSTVLASFCLATQHESLQPVRVIATALQPGRLGIIRRSGESELVAIRIKEDLASDKWVAGDGVSPLELFAAPAVSEAESERHDNSDTPS